MATLYIWCGKAAGQSWSLSFSHWNTHVVQTSVHNMCENTLLSVIAAGVEQGGQSTVHPHRTTPMGLLCFHLQYVHWYGHCNQALAVPPEFSRGDMVRQLIGLVMVINNKLPKQKDA